MKNKLMILTILLALVLAACGAETATSEPAQTTEESTMTEEAGATAGVTQTGPGESGVSEDLDDVMRVLLETGATAQLADPVESDVLSAPGQIVLINDEEVEFYTYASAEEAAAQAPLVADLTNPEGEPQFYRLGNMIVRYVGSNDVVHDLLENVLGAQAAGQ
jgi:hypothetical protein